MEENKPDKLDKCYYWHIVTLATMKYKLRNLMKGVRQMEGKHMRDNTTNLNERLQSDKDFKIELLNSQLQHKNNEIKDFKQQILSTLKRIVDIGEANNYNNSKIAVRRMKEIAEETYRRIAVDLYDLDLPSQENEIELQTTGKSSKQF